MSADFEPRLEPQTDAEFQSLDHEETSGEIRRAVHAARTEDECLDALRSAGGLGAGIDIAFGGTHPSMRQIARECEAMDDAELDAYLGGCRRSHVRFRRDGKLGEAGFCLSCAKTAEDVRSARTASTDRKEIA